VILFGHTHLPYQKSLAAALFVNAGSVGKPKDGDPRAGYVILEVARRPKVLLRRVAYDVTAAARAVRESGLPPHFADLLETGGLTALPAAANRERRPVKAQARPLDPDLRTTEKGLRWATCWRRHTVLSRKLQEQDLELARQVASEDARLNATVRD
jgi:hypothetical protein